MHAASPPSNVTWLPLHHRHGPCSPSSSSHSAGSRRRSRRRTSTTLASSLRRDQLRVDDILRRAVEVVDDVTVPTALGTSVKTLEYVVTVGLGTPAVHQTVLIDTGSDLSWVQCRPCPVPPCHRQKDAVFDPSKSSTFASIPCASPACARLGAQYASGCSRGGQCGYAVNYTDGSSTTGTYSSDTLTTTSSGSGGVVSGGFTFGCSHSEPGFSDPDRTDGILGIGGGAQSLVSQIRRRVFSYCLPRASSHTGFLTLGVPRISSSRFAVTPMRRFRKIPTFYVVILQAITVAGRRLDVAPSMFSAGSIMDSGTIITRLPPTAYSALRAAFRAEMNMYRLARPFSILDTCFNLTGVRRVQLPRVALVFDGGATVELHSSGILQYSCLAFAPNDDDTTPGIIGNVQQRTLEVLYDVGGRSVGFRRGAC